MALIMAFGFGRLPDEMRDFEVYWTAAARALDAEPLYRVADGHYQFKYLPAFAVFASPMAMVPLATAKALWFATSAALLAAVVGLSIGILPERRRSGLLIAAVIVLTMGKFYGHELVLGQVNLLFAALVLLGLVMVRRQRSDFAAALFVAAMVVKPYAVLLLPWLVFRGGRRAAVPMFLSVVAVLLAPVILYGMQGTVGLHSAWWTTVTGSTAPNLTNADNVSFAGFFSKWLGGGIAAAASTAIGSAALLGLIALVMSRSQGVREREMLEGALLLTAVPLLSPQGWDYVFLVATPAVAFLANYDRDMPWMLRGLCWIALLTIGLSLFDLMGRERYAAFMAWSIITVCFVVVIAGLSGLRLRKVA